MFGKAARTRGFGLFSLVVLIALAHASESEVDHEEDHVDDTHIIVTRDTKGPEWNYEDKEKSNGWKQFEVREWTNNLLVQFLGSHFPGPATWKTKYSSYCSGVRQSPIDINTKEVDVDEDITELDFDDIYDNPMKDAFIKNNGHTVVVQPGPKDPERTFTEGGFDDVYEFEQLHFHWGSDSKRGSEHTIDSKQYPLEMHLVHRNTNYKTLQAAVQKEDGIAVLAVLFKVTDEDNDALDPIIEKLDEVQKEGDTAELDDLNLEDLLPDDLMPFYTYEGSLTTPPCNEVVTWVIFKDFATISETQLEQFRNLKESDAGEEDETLVNNFRPTQPLHGRVVEVTGEGSSATTSTLSMALLLLPLLLAIRMALGKQ